MTRFLQWNIRGLQANREELDMLLSLLHPSVICLQETFLRESKNITFKGFSSYQKPAQEINGVLHGGSAILVNSSIPHRQLDLQTCLQAVAVRISCQKAITVCSIYLPPTSKWTKNDLEDLINQLPPPIVLLGDFNAHSTEWGCSKNDSKGKMISDLMLQRNLSLLNDGSATYLHPASGSQSAIDLSICDPSLYLDLSWKVHEDLCGSDHFPIIIYSDRAMPQ